LGFPRGMSMKFSLWTFHELSILQTILILLTFGCPSNQVQTLRFLHISWKYCWHSIWEAYSCNYDSQLFFIQLT